MPFTVQVHHDQGRTVVGLSGELDVEPAADLRTLFDMLVEDRYVDVLVDLRQLTFCDSAGLSALIHGYQVCSAAGGALRVTGDTGLVSRLLHVTGVRGILNDQSGVCDAAQSTNGARLGVPSRGMRGWQWISEGSGHAQAGGESTDGPAPTP